MAAASHKTIGLLSDKDAVKNLWDQLRQGK